MKKHIAITCACVCLLHQDSLERRKLAHPAPGIRPPLLPVRLITAAWHVAAIVYQKRRCRRRPNPRGSTPGQGTDEKNAKKPHRAAAAPKEELFEPEGVFAERVNGDTKQFQVKWAGWVSTLPTSRRVRRVRARACALGQQHAAHGRPLRCAHDVRAAHRRPLLLP